MATTSYTVAATFHVRVDAVGAMKRLSADVTGPSLTEDGVEIYHWSQGADDPTWFLLYTRISQMTSFALACDLRNTPEKQGPSANPCRAERKTQWVTAKRAICGSVLTAG